MQLLRETGLARRVYGTALILKAESPMYIINLAIYMGISDKLWVD